MPEYTYHCNACDYEFDLKQNYHDKAKRKCPECKRWKLHRIIFAPHIYTYSEPQTVGLLAERNTKKLGKYELQKKLKDIDDKSYIKPSELPKNMSRIKQSKEKPWYRPSQKIDMSLDKLTPKQKEKYIATGKK